jgi:3'-phosphoadenosine 5'-phosphosulfate sulfotransferase (PAPS reductase)/FAD synthetase
MTAETPMASVIGNGWPRIPLEQIEATPVQDVARLLGFQRQIRVGNLIGLSRRIATEAKSQLLRDRRVVAECILWSGGNDSNILAHLLRRSATHAIHANTGIGIEETRQHVRDTCHEWGLPLIEEHPPISYRDLVLERGFPGPAQHWKMYTRLKERCLDQARHKLGVARSRSKVAIFYAGRRREESSRRSQVKLWESDGSVIWISPLAFWTKLDLNTYRTMHHSVPRNRVSDLIHMSGECLCGAFAEEGELDMIGEWFPGVVESIRQLESDAKAVGIPYPLYLYGWGSTAEVKAIGTPAARALGEKLRQGSGPLCQSCSARRIV